MLSVFGILSHDGRKERTVSNVTQDCYARINDAATDYAHVQDAIDAAQAGDMIKIAGTCVGAFNRSGGGGGGWSVWRAWEFTNYQLRFTIPRMDIESKYNKSLDYLYSFVDYRLKHSSELAKAEFNLDRMFALMEELGNPQRNIPSST